MLIIPWICWCWRDHYWRSFGSAATTMENSLSISFLNALTITVSWSKISLHCICSFPPCPWEGSTFFANIFPCLKTLQSILYLQVDFLLLMRKPRCCRRKIKCPANSSSSYKREKICKFKQLPDLFFHALWLWK